MQKIENAMFVVVLIGIMLIGFLIYNMEKEIEQLERENDQLRFEIFELNNWIMKSEE